MEFQNWANQFVGTPLFAVLMILFLIGIGILLRMTFTSHNDDIYRHKPDD